jgi:hypothetical protein
LANENWCHLVDNFNGSSPALTVHDVSVQRLPGEWKTNENPPFGAALVFPTNIQPRILDRGIQENQWQKQVGKPT